MLWNRAQKKYKRIQTCYVTFHTKHCVSFLHKYTSLSRSLSLSGSPSLSGSATVTVLVDDVNDMVPLFSSSSYHTSISENAPTGSDVMLVNASDGDVGQNGIIRYCVHTIYT